MLSEGNAEAAAALDAASPEMVATVELQCGFMVRYLDASDSLAAHAEADGAPPPPPPPPPPVAKAPFGADDATAPTSEPTATEAGGQKALYAARMQAATEAAVAMEVAAAREGGGLADAATQFERGAAVEQAIDMSIRVCHRFASSGESHRVALLRHGAVRAAYDAVRANSNSSERLWHLCGTIAQLSTSEAEQRAVWECGCVAELIEIYEDALVCGLDADSHRMRAEIGAILANLAHGADGDRRAEIVDAGGEEALGEAVAEGEQVEGMAAEDVVGRLDDRQHHAPTLQAACGYFLQQVERAVMLASQAQTVADFIDAGVVRAIAAGLRRHAASDAVATSALTLLAVLCRWQPRAALLLCQYHLPRARAGGAALPAPRPRRGFGRSGERLVRPDARPRRRRRTDADGRSRRGLRDRSDRGPPPPRPRGTRRRRRRRWRARGPGGPGG